MLRSFHFLLLLFTYALIGCSEGRQSAKSGDDSNTVYVDEVHRTGDWESEMDFTLNYKKPSGGKEFHLIDQGSFRFTRPMEAFVEQVFAMAFSGEVKVYLPAVLGGPNIDLPISPESLVKTLNRFDTILTEDLETGELVETQIDQSFSKSRVSALVVFSKVSKKSAIVSYNPHMLMLGEQTFDPETGEFRGVTPRFYLDLEEGESSDQAADQNFYFLTDSVGDFYLDRIGAYLENASMPNFGQIMFSEAPDAAALKFHQHWSLSSKNGSITIVSEVSEEQPEL